MSRRAPGTVALQDLPRAAPEIGPRDPNAYGIASMTHELILTSVSQGLEPDGQGFCVVAANRDIPPLLQKRLLPLSAYQHLFPPETEDARLHPVAFSHLIVPAAERSYHVLSRVADTGTDYRHEPNHLAHHVVLDEGELVAEGPAWLLALPGFHLTEWLTPAVRFSNGRPIPTLIAPPPLTRRQRIARERAWLEHRKMSLRHPMPEESELLDAMIRDNEEQSTITGPPTSPCPLWKELTGDAGWGGVLAETIRTGQPATVLFRPGLNLLPLFVEALSLLPASLFWKATFHTYYTRLPERVACQWKGVLADSPESRPFLADPEQLVIDLSASPGSAPFGPYVEFARFGVDNMLPDDEIIESLFQAEAPPRSDEMDTVTIPPTTQRGAAAASSPPPLQSPPPPHAPLPADSAADGNTAIPPVLPEETTFRIQTRSSSTSGGALQSFLNTKSRGQFYVLYAATFLLVVFLLVLVLDQVVGFGLADWIRGRGPASTTVATNPASDDGSDGKTGAGAGATGKLDAASVQKERERLQKEEREQAAKRAREEESRKKRLRERAAQARSAFRERQRQDAAALDGFLAEYPLPPFLPLKGPAQQGHRIVPPDSQTFAELTPFHSLASALHLELVPLLAIPKIRIETEKQAFFIDQDDTKTNRDASEPVADGPGASETGTAGTMLDGVRSSADLSESDAELWIPDPNRFEWSVFAVDTATERKTPIFRMKLTEQGLVFDWERAAFSSQYFHDAVSATLGSLRLSVDEDGDATPATRSRSIALFEPSVVAPVYPAREFANSEKAVLTVETPFAVEPWKTLFETLAAPYVFRIDVRIRPDAPVGIREIDVKLSESPSRYLVDFKTEIFSRKGVSGRREELSPILIPFEARVDPFQVVWSDRYNDQTELLKEELESSRADYANLKRDEDAVRSDIFNAGSDATSDMRQRRNELTAQTSALNARIREIEDILRNLPFAHEKIVKNELLHFDYSVYLVPVSDAAEFAGAGPKTPGAEDDESILGPKPSAGLLVMTTSAPKTAGENKDGDQPVPEPAPLPDAEPPAALSE